MGVYIVDIKIRGVGDINDIFYFLKNILILAETPDYIVLMSSDLRSSKMLEVVPLRWLYLSSATDFFNWLSAILDKNEGYTNQNEVVYYLQIHYSETTKKLISEVERLRTLINEK